MVAFGIVFPSFSWAVLNRAIACRLTIKVNKWQPNETNNWRINHCIEQWNLCAFIANHAKQTNRTPSNGLARIKIHFDNSMFCSLYAALALLMSTAEHTAKSHTHYSHTRSICSNLIKKIAYCFFFPLLKRKTAKQGEKKRSPTELNQRLKVKVMQENCLIHTVCGTYQTDHKWLNWTEWLWWVSTTRMTQI